MPFYDRLYDLYIVLGSPDAQPLWEWPAWQRTEQIIDPLVRSARGSPGMRIHRESSKAGIEKGLNEFAYQAGSASLWVSGAPGSSIEPDSRFYSGEVWAPHWETCKQEKKLPDFYFALRNESACSEYPAVNPLLAMSVAVDLPDKTLTAANQAAGQIADLLQARLRAYQRRPWGYPWSDGSGFTDGIGDLLAFPLYKIPENQAMVPAQLQLDILGGEWEIF